MSLEVKIGKTLTKALNYLPFSFPDPLILNTTQSLSSMSHEQFMGDRESEHMIIDNTKANTGTTSVSVDRWKTWQDNSEINPVMIWTLGEKHQT